MEEAVVTKARAARTGRGRKGGQVSGGSEQPPAPDGDRSGRSSQQSYERLRRRLAVRGIAAVLLAAAALYGLYFDQSIRRDPFTAAPGPWEWLASNQPHPALARLPVVPVGARGVLTFRPADTAWVNSPYFPGEADGAPAQQPTAGGPFVGTAHAEDLRQFAQQQMQQEVQSPAQQQEQEPAQQQEQEPASDLGTTFLPGENPEGRPRIVHAQCLPADDLASSRCILARENDTGLFEYNLAEGAWTLTALASPGAGEQAAGIGFFAFAPDGETGIALSLRAGEDYYVTNDLLPVTPPPSTPPTTQSSRDFGDDLDPTYFVDLRPMIAGCLDEREGAGSWSKVALCNSRCF